jgi:guanylate kinase
MEQVEKRFDTAFEEIKMIPEYDYVVVNDVVDKAVHHLEAIMEAERCRTARSAYLTEAIEEIGR